MSAFIPLLIIILVLVGAVLSTIYVVPQQKAYVIERLGKFNRVSGAGLHVRIPVLEKIVGKVDLKTNQSSFGINAKTKDNVTIQMHIAAQFRVDNTLSTEKEGGIYRSFYILAQPIDQMNSYLADALRSSIPNYSLDEVFEKKDNIAQDVNTSVATQMTQYGYIVISTLITNIELPADVESSMNRINSAQRDQVAAQALAEAERIKVVTEARAQAEAAEQAGIGIANQRKAIAEGIQASLDTIQKSGVSEQEANMLFLFTQWTDMMAEFAKSGTASTVVLPSNFKETSGMFEQILTASKAE